MSDSDLRTPQALAVGVCQDSVPWMVELSPDDVNKLSKRSVIDLFQLRSVSQLRLIRKLGTITEMEFKKIFEALKAVFGIY